MLCTRKSWLRLMAANEILSFPLCPLIEEERNGNPIHPYIWIRAFPRATILTGWDKALCSCPDLCIRQRLPTWSSREDIPIDAIHVVCQSLLVDFRELHTTGHIIKESHTTKHIVNPLPRFRGLVDRFQTLFFIMWKELC